MRRDLANKPPTYLVIEMHRGISLLDKLKVPAWVDEMVAKDYRLEKRITFTFKTLLDDQNTDGFLIYRRAR